MLETGIVQVPTKLSCEAPRYHWEVLADLLFQSRTYRVRLPELSTFQNDDREIRERDAKNKSQAKRYADRMRYIKTSSTQEGDAVLVRNEKKGKLEPKYDP